MLARARSSSSDFDDLSCYRMDNQWQLSKCGSTCQSSAEPAVVVAPSPVSQAQLHDSSRNSMMSASHYYYPNIVQEPCSSTRKMMADPLFQHSNINLYNSSLSAIGTSFFTLLSGPPASISKYDSQQLLSSKPPNPSSKVHVYSSSSIVSPTECEPSFGSPKLSSHKIDKRYLKPKIDGCPVSDGGNTASCLHDIVQARKVGDASLELTKSAIYHTSRGIKQVNGYSSLKTVPTFGATPVKAHQLSPIASGLPRVFCLYASGDLFFSSSGLLGVVCSCHGFRMSISKFSEHSGLQDVNPGDIVHVDSGETIAQWRKVYFGKFGIRMSEDQHGWHWPQGFSAAPDLVKKSERVPNLSRTADLSKSAGPPRPSNKMVFPDKHHSSQNLVNKIICHEVQRNTHDKRELPKGFTETSQSNTHGGATNKIIEQLVSGCLSMSKFAGGLDNTFQSNPTLDPIYRTKNSFTSQNSLQNIRSLGKDSDKFYNSRDVDTPVKAIVSSNIELRLGQPSQQSNAPGFHTPHVSRVGHPLELVSSQPKLYNAGSNRITEERKQVVDCAAQAAKSSVTGGQNCLNFSNLGFGAYSTRMTLQPEQEATRVMNAHTPLSRQSLKYSNQDDIASCRGFGKDQIVQGNSLNENSRSSMTLPSKLTGRDGYKLASKYNLPEHATKSVHYGTTSWTAGGADKSAVISSFQIRDTGVHSNHLCNPDQTGPSLPRIGRTENNGSSSGHGNCCQGTPCAYVPDKCSCWVQRNTMTENSNLQGKNSVSAFGEPSQIRTSILSASKLNPSAKIGETMKPNLKKVEISAFQWKDVPSKMSGRCHVPCKDQKTKFLEDPIEVNDQTSGVADQPVQKADYMKEQVMSNISSKCSTPALTQASVKISNGDSCTDDAHNTGCAKNFAVDEGSGIQKSSSSDDALDSGGNTGFDGSACKINFKNGPRSLIDELRVIDSFRMKKVHNQVHTGLLMYEKTSSMKTFERDIEAGKRKRETKFKILGTPFPASPVSSLSTGSSGQSSQSLEDVHRSTEELPCKKRKGIYDDCLEIHEGKKTRLDFDFSKRKPCKRIIRPVVCGRYGLISNGDTSKPAKIFSLGKILKTSKRCDPPRNKVIKKLPAKVLKKSIIREGNRRSGRISSFKENKYHIGEETTVVSDEDPVETSKDSDTSYVLKKGRESGNERNHGIPDSDLGTRIRRKTKEVRKRSIYELITKGKDSTFATISKDIVSLPRDNLNHGNSNNLHGVDNMCRSREELTYKSTPDMNTFCHVCGSLNNDDMNCLLECNRCLVKVHQACYGISKVPKSDWCCRPCREDATDMVCVLCGYEGGVMTQAVHSTNIVRTLLNAWNVITESQKDPIVPPMVLNSVTAGFFDSTIKQWVHMVCGLWTPGTRCPNVDTMSTFDVSGACHPEGNVVCSMCKRAGGCCIRCRVMDCAIHFHPWCAHQKGLLQSEIEGADNENVGFYGRCELHATEHHFKHKNNSRSIQVVSLDEKETCARTEGYKGRKREGFRHDSKQNPSGSSGCVVRQEQVDAWNHINQQLSFKKRIQRTTQPVQDVEADPRKEYARYKQSKGWKQLVVYKSGIHALGLYTTMFISQSEMVVEYVGEIVGLRVADRRESEYQSGKQLQYKSACYFFRIDKEHIIDATRKGGIARFVNHSCQPNCVAKVITVRGEKKVVFFAERDIYPGEEITYDYHFNNEDEAKKILCSCNSNNCRRYLN